MKNLKTSILLVFSFLFLATINSESQHLNFQNEYIIKFVKPTNVKIEYLTTLISIDKVKGDSIVAYVNTKQLKTFQKLNIPFSLIIKEKATLATTSGNIWDWNKYPTLSEYIQMLDSMQQIHPDLCKIITFGNSALGKPIYYARINKDTSIYKPSVLLSSTIHGDETGGSVVLTRLIFYLLDNYGKSSTVTNLIDNLDIWINPVFNPDGRFASTMNRSNGNYVDLNRNFPDIFYGSHPDNNDYQPETRSLMNLYSTYNFVLSATLHAGAEVANYPWDASPSFHADKQWFENVSHEYADTAMKYGPVNYFQTLYPDGVIDGWYWYPVYGGRQDYVTGVCHSRETTLEIDDNKFTPENELETLWQANYRSLLNYINNATKGIHGIVYDKNTNTPIKATIEVVNYDDSLSVVYSDTKTGHFTRLLPVGTYTLKIYAKGYDTLTVENTYFTMNTSRQLTAYLTPSAKNYIDNNFSGQIKVFPNPAMNTLFISGIYDNEIVLKLCIYNTSGVSIPDLSLEKNTHTIDISHIPDGFYFVFIQTSKKVFKSKFIKRTN
ncbi:MAG TPA: M14 family zinc carboxypeptidase [Bacteroidales bacterium]|nr:M14 family zinc carboxypeptidase [Bacteroidales bacterium]